MDRKAWIAIILSVLGLVLWQWSYVKNYSPKPHVATPEAVVAKPTPSQDPVSTPAPVREEPVIAAQNQSLYSKTAEYVFSDDKGGIERAILLLHLGENQQAVFLNGNRAMPIGAIGENPGEAWGGFTMETDQGKGEAIFTRKDADGLEITKRFILPESGAKDGNYLVRMELGFRNAGSADVERKGYFVFAGGAAPIHHNDLPIYTKFDWMHEGKFETIDVNWFDPSSIPLLGIPIRDARSLYLETKKDVTWTGVASQYFCTIVTTEKTKGISAWATRYDTRKLDNARVYGIQGGIGMPAFSLAPGQSLIEVLPDLCRTEGSRPASQTGWWSGRSHELRDVRVCQRVPPLGDEQPKCGFSQLCRRHHYPDHHYQIAALADSEQGDQSNAKDVAAVAENDGASGEVQGRSPKNERGGDEAL